MPDYQLGKIYKLICNVTDLVYIGSTCEPSLARRMSSHRRNYYCWKNGNYHWVLSSFKLLSFLLLPLFKILLHVIDKYSNIKIKNNSNFIFLIEIYLLS
jgi:hypothetical protein